MSDIKRYLLFYLKSKMGPYIILVNCFLIVLFVVIMIIAGKTNDDVHKCVYPVVPHCYLDWKCPQGDSGTTTNMLTARENKKKELNDCVNSQKNYQSCLTYKIGGCRDPSYNYNDSGSSGSWEPVAQKFDVNGPLSALIPGSGIGNSAPTLTLGQGGSPISPSDKADKGPTYCQTSGSEKNKVPSQQIPATN